MNIKVGDIVFFRDNSLLSKTICLVETGKFGRIVPSHCGVVSCLAGENVYIIEAQFGGVREVLIKKYKKSIKWYARMKGERDIQKGIDYLNNMIGRTYDIPQIIGIYMRGFWRLLGPKVYEKSRTVRNYLDSKTSFICSELVERYAEVTGDRLWPHAEISLITPYDLWRSSRLDIYRKELA